MKPRWLPSVTPSDAEANGRANRCGRGRAEMTHHGANELFHIMRFDAVLGKELCGAVTVVAPRLRRLRGGVCGEGVCGEGGHVPVEKVCKSLHMFKSLHMALVGHITRTRGPLPNKNCQLPSTALKLLPKRIPGTHPANLI